MLTDATPGWTPSTLMKILDRYIMRLYLLNFVILFVVITGLILLINLIVNFDKFVNAAAQEGGNPLARAWHIISLAADFYGPQIFLYYNYMVGLLPVGAAAFTLTQLLRTRELTAILAGGISMQRIAMPILALGFAANVLMVLNQELMLPSMAQQLQRRHGDIAQEHARELQVRFMPDSSGALYTAAAFEVANNALRDVTILVRESLGDGRFGWASLRITADRAVWDDDRKGWSLSNGISVQRETSNPAEPDLTTRRADPIDFIASDLDPVSIVQRERARFRQFLSTKQLDQLIERSALLDPGELRRIKHSRFSMVVVNMLILGMALPFFLLRSPQNMLMQVVKVAPLCIGAWGGGFLMMQIAAPGNIAPAVIAWLPVAIYTPIAIYLMDAIES
ncbi:MAG: LptF/LptG family permease [Phycisphaeraceae bacterium]